MLRIFIFCGVTVSVLSLHKQSIEFDALDCRTPKGLLRSKTETVCTHTKHAKAETPRVAHILQYDRTRVLNAITCSLKKTKLLAYCGSFSHQKLLEPPDVLKSEPVSREKCMQVHKTHLYSREDGKQATISINRPYVYKYLEHGSISSTASNVKCQGEQFSINGKLKSNIIELVTAQFILREIKMETNPQGEIRDLDSGYELPMHCVHDRYCYMYERMYVLMSPIAFCPLYLVRSLKMVKTKYLTVDKSEHRAYVSHEHQLILERGEIFHPPEGCRNFPTLYDTNYEKIKIITHQHTSAKIKALKPFSLDVGLQAQILHDYSNFRAEELVYNQIDSVLHKVCEINKFGINGAERDPFRRDFLMQQTGEVTTRFHCTNVTVVARLGDNKGGKCFRDALPVFLGRERLVLTANTRILLDEHDVEKTACSDQFPPIIFSKKGNMVTANPTVKLANVTLFKINSELYPTHVQGVHETAEHFALYTQAEMRDFNSLIHFGRTKQAILSELTDKYCADQSCGTMGSRTYESSFDLNRLKAQIETTFDIEGYFKRAVATLGQIGGCLYLVNLIWKVVFKVMNIHHLYVKRNTTFQFAIKRNFNRDQQINDLMLAGAADELELQGHEANEAPH